MPRIAETRLKEWNKFCPMYSMSNGKSDLDDPHGRSGASRGEQVHSQIQNLRARMVDERLWPMTVKGFWKKWTEWKEQHLYIDFTDMIEMAYRRVVFAPGDPVVGFFDEVQDFTPLELALVRKWGKQMKFIILAGDDDQCIYGFKGSTPDSFLTPDIPDDQKKTLPLSYRLPRPIYEYSERWVRQLSIRQPKKYEPSKHEGHVIYNNGCTYMDSAGLTNRAWIHARDGLSVMILASCGYMLTKIMHQFRMNGTPFWNPYRHKRGDWNPLTFRHGTSMASRIQSFLKIENGQEWTGSDFKAFVKLLDSKSGALKHGAKTKVDFLPDEEAMEPWLLEDYLQAEAIDECYESKDKLQWLVNNSLISQRKKMEYPINIIRRHGIEKLREDPLITIGTIHSVKGGEADVVFVLPDLSMSGMEQWQGNIEQQDMIVRQFYVAFTRARQTLVLCAPSSGMKVDFL